MKKTVKIYIHASAIYLFCVGAFFTLKEQIYPDYKLGQIPWWVALISIIGTAIAASALFFAPNLADYKKRYKFIAGIILFPFLIIFLGNAYDCIIRILQDRYRDGFIYAFSFFIGTVSVILGFYFLIFNKTAIKGTKE